MASSTIIDTYPAFAQFWGQAKNEPVDRQIDLWLQDYMSHWPELVEKQINCHAGRGYDWRQVARERIFPFLDQREAGMADARENLLRCVAPVGRTAQEVFGSDLDLVFVLYVGIGCGAGWAASYSGKPAVLFGLEKIAKLNWTALETVEALTAHELGHILHLHLRGEAGEPEAAGDFAALYGEGVAKRSEELILGESRHYETLYHKDDWLKWCTDNRAWLAAEFLRKVDQGEPTNVFFGDWFKVRDHSQCGYFLGLEVVRAWEENLSFQAIVVMPPDKVNTRVRDTLQEMAAEAL
ncbi:MAG: hypothetical protein Q7T82_01470 [Armatimonadota bacterium]|nr:hypothetical protein [Armatimonadota bacterium]